MQETKPATEKPKPRTENLNPGIEKLVSGIERTKPGIGEARLRSREGGKRSETKKPIPKAHEWLNSAERFENQTLQPLLH